LCLAKENAKYMASFGPFISKNQFISKAPLMNISIALKSSKARLSNLV
jgi:hypothetical protein